MTEYEAAQCLVGMIVFDRRDWSDAQVAAWNKAIRRFTDMDVALRAGEQLVEEIEPHNWSLPMWRTAYHQLAERKAQEQRDAQRACSTCDGTGYVEALDFHAPYCRDPVKCHCHAVDPCPSCSTGDPGPAGRHQQLEPPIIPPAEGKVIALKAMVADMRARGCSEERIAKQRRVFDDYISTIGPEAS